MISNENVVDDFKVRVILSGGALAVMVQLVLAVIENVFISPAAAKLR